MQRREAVRRAASVFGIAAVAGCAEVDDLVSGTSDRAADEAEQTVNETLEEELVRPPNARVEIREGGTIVVLSLDPDTVGVKCGLIEGDDPVAEVRESDRATTTAGTRIEGCEDELVIAVNEAGDVEIIAEP